MTTPIRAPGRQPGIVRSTTVAAAAATAALALGRTAAGWAARDAEAFLTSGDLPVDGLVALLAVSVGAVAATILAVGCTLLAAAAATRLVARSLQATARAARVARVIGRRLEQAGSRLTPLALRRALAIGIGAGLGLAGPVAAATADEADLGWAVTSTTETVAPALAVPEVVAPTPAAPEVVRPTADVPEVVAPTAVVPEVVAPTADVPEVVAPTPAVPAGESAGDSGWQPWPVSTGTRPTTPSQQAAEPTPAPSPAPAIAVAGTSPERATVPSPTVAGTGTADEDVAAPPAGAAVGGDVVDPTTASAPGRSGAPARVPAPVPAETVVAQPGDSLWSIAEAALGPGASDGQIAEAWPRWWAANRALIGADPDVIHPGQVLTAPRDDLTSAPLEENP